MQRKIFLDFHFDTAGVLDTGRVGSGADLPRKRITFVGHLFIAVSVCSLG